MTEPLAAERTDAVSDEQGAGDFDRSIALCGFMGVGKSAIGKALAQKLGWTFYDTDAEVAARLGRDIPELFASGDEPLFRRTEADVIAELCATRPPAVISLGGGALENAATRARLLAETLLVHIDQDWELLRPALTQLRVERPLLLGRSAEEIHALFLARQQNYACAHVHVQTSRGGVRDAAARVLEALKTQRA